MSVHDKNEDRVNFYSLRLFSKDLRMAISPDILTQNEFMIRYDNQSGICEIKTYLNSPVTTFRIGSQSYYQDILNSKKKEQHKLLLE